MLIRLLYLFIIPIFMGCLIHKDKREKSLLCIEGINLFPKFNAQGIISSYDTGLVKVYSYKNQLYLYEVPIKRRVFDSLGTYKIDKITNYILFHADSSYGYHFDSSNRQIQKIVKMDSVFKVLWLTANKIYPYISANSSKIVSKRETRDSLFVEYEIRKKGELTKELTLQLHFSKRFPQTAITLSKEIDSLYNMKLVKSLTNIEPIYIKENNSYTSRFNIATSIRELTKFDKVKAVRFFSLLDSNIKEEWEAKD